MNRILYIGNSLIKHGFTPTGIDYLGDALSGDYVITKLSDSKNPALRLLSMIFGVLKNARNTDLAIIDLYSTYAFWFAVILASFCRALKMPYILVARGGDLDKRFKKTGWAASEIWKNAAARVVPSKYLYERLIGFGEEIELLNNHIKIENYEFTKRKNLNVSLLYARAVHKKYNPDLLIRVVWQLHEKGFDATLHFVGNIKDDSDLRCIALAKDLGVENAITFKGKMSKTEWCEYSRLFDIFVNPTSVDNTPISVIEAMALGIPVVSTNVGGIPFLVKDQETALLVNNDDAEGFTSAILKLLSDDVLVQKLTLNARKLAESFDWQQMRPKWIKLITKCCTINS